MVRSKDPQNIILIFSSKLSNTRVTIIICLPHLLIQHTTQMNASIIHFASTTPTFPHYLEYASPEYPLDILFKTSVTISIYPTCPLIQHTFYKESVTIFPNWQGVNIFRISYRHSLQTLIMVVRINITIIINPIITMFIIILKIMIRIVTTILMII